MPATQHPVIIGRLVQESHWVNGQCSFRNIIMQHVTDHTVMPTVANHASDVTGSATKQVFTATKERRSATKQVCTATKEGLSATKGLFTETKKTRSETKETQSETKDSHIASKNCL